MKPGRITAARVAGALVLTAVLAYASGIVYLVTQETRLVFAAQAPLGDRRPALPYEDVVQTPVEGTRQPYARAWLLPSAPEAEAKPWLMFLHGNDANIASRMNILHYERLRQLGVNVIAPEYRGYAGLSGVPSEAGLAADAQRWYDYLREQKRVDPARIIIYGWSLGSAVAVDLASRVGEAAVILEGAPASIVAIGQQRYPYFPVRMLIRNPFESINKIDKVKAPVLFLHSPEDVIVPLAEGRRLFAAAPGPKQFVEVAGGHVYASERDPRFFPAIRAFLQANHLLP